MTDAASYGETVAMSEGIMERARSVDQDAYYSDVGITGVPDVRPKVTMRGDVWVKLNEAGDPFLKFEVKALDLIDFDSDAHITVVREDMTMRAQAAGDRIAALEGALRTVQNITEWSTSAGHRLAAVKDVLSRTVLAGAAASEACPVCGRPDKLVLAPTWQQDVEAGHAIPIVGCGDPWHYEGLAGAAASEEAS
jgi:hypothetical protein